MGLGMQLNSREETWSVSVVCVPARVELQKNGR